VVGTVPEIDIASLEGGLVQGCALVALGESIGGLGLAGILSSSGA
jgi:hypothetical protein